MPRRLPAKLARVHTYEDVANVLKNKLKFETPKQTLHEKKGRGIFRRHIFTVPAVGDGSPNQRIVKGKEGGISGSQRCRQFTVDSSSSPT